MEELEEVKKFIKVDFDDDDEYIKLLILAGKDYISNSIKTYDPNNARMKLLLITLISTLYENREYTVNTSNEKIAYTIRSMCMQLQLEFDEGDIVG